ncbi:MAG: hypothetical protein NVS1B4_20510 [Gemmatimonadaceae bacterium]
MTHPSPLDTPLTRAAKIRVPVVCGAMYPCSNPELVAAASEAGAIGVVQPISLTYVHGYDLREGLRYIRQLTARPIGFNALIEQSSATYHQRMQRWVAIALEEGVRFFVTSLGNPRWVADAVHRLGGVVFHDVTELKWARKAADAGVDGLIAVNDRAGGHAGTRSARALYDELAVTGLPLVCAGGIGAPPDLAAVMTIGYVGAQMGTRFIATTECSARADYKQAILDAAEDDIVLTERISGIPVSVIRNAYVKAMGTRAGPVARLLLRGRRTKHWMRTAYGVRSLWQLKRSSVARDGESAYWQAGKSVAGIHDIVPVAEVVRRFVVGLGGGDGVAGG